MSIPHNSDFHHGLLSLKLREAVGVTQTNQLETVTTAAYLW